MSDKPFSLSRAIRYLIERGIPTNRAEMEPHFEIARAREKNALLCGLEIKGR